MVEAAVTWKGRIIPSAKISSAGEESPGSKLFEIWNSKEFDESRRVSSLRIRPDGSITSGGALSDWPRSLENEIRWSVQIILERRRRRRRK